MTLLTHGTILASRYRVHRHLGEGGMSDVYRELSIMELIGHCAPLGAGSI